ncbi:MAG: hypothetical protein RIQ54_326 [Candidatus Parcubacteria bacterium]|jgi:undecaprenyl-diphosphatase
MNLNAWLFTALFSISHRNYLLDEVVVFFAEFLPYLMVGAIGYLIYTRQTSKLKYALVIQMSLAAILSRGIIAEAIKFFMNVPRPAAIAQINPLVVTDLYGSFPSGHVSFFFALAVTVIFYNKKWGWGLIAAATVNGIARIIAGVHYPIDIAGGILVAVVSALAIRMIVKKEVDSIQKQSSVEIKNNGTTVI